MIDTRPVILDVPEVHYALALATQRDASKANRDSRISRKHTGFGVHFAGVIGELCFRKVHGGSINKAILPGGDKHTPDVILPDGRGVEVKTSLFPGDPDLIFEENELDACECCSLVQVTLPDKDIVYPVWDWAYIKPRLKRKDYGYGIRWAFNPRSMNERHTS